MSITAADVAKLRELTGAGMMDAKRALEENGGDIEKSIDALRKSGAAKAAKKAERTTAEGKIFAYTHGNKLAVMVELLCETDFVARNETFQALAHDLALHVTAANPAYLTPDDIPADVLAKEREIATEQAKAGGKPVAIMEKIVEGKLQKFFDESCLLRQPFVKDDSMTITELLEQTVAKIGEKIEVRRFVRMQL